MNQIAGKPIVATTYHGGARMQLDQVPDTPNRRTHHNTSLQTLFPPPDLPSTTTGDSDAESSDVDALRSTGVN
ncbi:hypothetical protein HanIR_Chr16g0831321 [Helianthus annuus]|nr:hypothetical protein HanIR_Chr16g0831321 [Helianthus annuus]